MALEFTSSMTKWLNPRVFTVAISIIVMVQVSKVGEPHTTIRNDILACLLMLLLYAGAFLLPLQRTFGSRAVAGSAALLVVAWLAVGMALVSDALPMPLSIQMERSFNWPMVAFCTGGFVAFFLFFTQMARSFALRDEILEAQGLRDY